MAFTDTGVADPQFDLDPFQQLVSEKIAELGDDNHPPADRFDFGRQTEDRSFDFAESPSGRLEYGERFLTHGVDVDEFRVVYAFRPERIILPYRPPFYMVSGTDFNPEEDSEPKHFPPDAHVDVYEFMDEDSGLLSRTSFTSTDASQVQKARYTKFNTRDVNPPELRRDLNTTEAKRLFEALIDPGAVTVRGIIELTRRDQRTIAKNNKQWAQFNAAHQRRMEAIHRAVHVTIPFPDRRY